MKPNNQDNTDRAKSRYQKERIGHWNGISAKKTKPRQIGAFYHQLLQYYYRFLVPPGLRILELGCGQGNLLASLSPHFGVGVDFSDEMIRCASRNHPHLHFIRADAHEVAFKEGFDVILLSGLVNDLWDVQTVFENLQGLTRPQTRIILDFYNHTWRIPLSIAKILGLGADVLDQNWFSPHDIFNLLKLADFEVVKRNSFVLLPVKIPLLSGFANRYLVHIPPFRWFALQNIVVARPGPNTDRHNRDRIASVSIVVAARNESGNIESLLRRIPQMGRYTEIVFVEGHSTDDTYETIERMIDKFPEKRCRLFGQMGEGKGDAIRLGFEKAEGEILMILDADLTVPPEDLPRFFHALLSRKGEFINGVRLVYPMETQSMRFLNILGNKFFSLAFSWLLGQPVKDTLCGTKVLWKRDYDLIAKNRSYFGDFDPFGDFDLLFGAAKLNLKIAEVPIRYRSRVYGETNIDRLRHGRLLMRMTHFAARRIKFI